MEEIHDADGSYFYPADQAEGIVEIDLLKWHDVAAFFIEKAQEANPAGKFAFEEDFDAHGDFRGYWIVYCGVDLRKKVRIPEGIWLNQLLIPEEKAGRREVVRS